MKKAAWVLFALALAGCGDEAATSSAVPQAKAAVVEPQPSEHYYSVEDGTEYGYEQGVSQNDQENGTLARGLMMFRYAGQRDGRHQAYTKDGMSTTVIECANPCEFMKVMVIFNGEFVSKELVRATDGSIGWGVVSDAINGFLKPHKTKDGKSHPWFDEKGIHFFPLADAEPANTKPPI